MVDIQESGAVSRVDRRPMIEATTIVSWEPEPPGIGLTVSYELVRRHTARVTLVGELDYSVVDQTRDALLSALSWAVHWVEVHAERLEFCDKAGLELLLEFDRRCAGHAGGLRIVSAQCQLIRMLDLTQESMLITSLGSQIG